MKRVAALVVAMGLVGAGLWFSSTLPAPQIWLYGAGLIGLVGIAVEAFLERPRSPVPRGHRQLFVLWIAPGLLTAAGLWLVRITPPDSLRVVAATAAAVVGLLLLGLRAGMNPVGPFHRLGRFVGSLILYLVAFLLFALIYHTKERSLITATSIGLVAFLAAMEILRSAEGGRGPDWRLPLVAALAVAETTWALNYWPVSGLIGGAVLLLTFYVLVGLLVALREGGLDRRVLAEYGTVAVAGLLAVSWAMF